MEEKMRHGCPRRGAAASVVSQRFKMTRQQAQNLTHTNNAASKRTERLQTLRGSNTTLNIQHEIKWGLENKRYA